jgi:leucyl aminopeptidase
MTNIAFKAQQNADPATLSTGCLIAPLFSGKKLSDLGQQLDTLTAGAISGALKLGDFSAKAGQTLLLPGAGKAKRILLIGCGDAKKFDRSASRKFINSVYRAVCATQAKDAVLMTEHLIIADTDASWLLEAIARTITGSLYRYTRTLSKPKKAPAIAKLIVSHSSDITTRAAQKALNTGAATGTGMNTAKELANLPANICTPRYLAEQARSLAKGNAKLSTQILDEKKMADLGMGALLSVSAGSDEPARLIVMNYKGGNAKQQPYVLVGKGVTFDTGGISLKPGAKMDEMKYDMGGAAGVFGTMEAISSMGLPINVVGIVGAVENMPSGGATKPGDVVTSMSGQTIEILNTDAEGRLVLCDALTYAERFNPKAVVDLATLTGACVVALGSHATAVYSNEDELAKQLLDAGITSHDRAWHMPLWDDYQNQLDTNFADVSNLGGPGGGSITAACFLSRFAKKYKWAHLDIAGTAWNSAPKGATGRPVALLTQYLTDRIGK